MNAYSSAASVIRYGRYSSSVVNGSERWRLAAFFTYSCHNLMVVKAFALSMAIISLKIWDWICFAPVAVTAAPSLVPLRFGLEEFFRLKSFKIRLRSSASFYATNKIVVLLPVTKATELTRLWSTSSMIVSMKHHSLLFNRKRQKKKSHKYTYHHKEMQIH